MKIIAKALLFDDEGKLLVLRRSDTHPHFAHHLDFPGGQVEEGEEVNQAVTREAKEETGLYVPPAELQLVHETPSSHVARHLVFRAKVKGREPQVELSWEHDKYLWLTPDKLLEEDVPQKADAYFLDALQYLESSRPAR